MHEFHILAHDNKNLQPTCIYRCGKGGRIGRFRDMPRSFDAYVRDAF